jgi:hypothetical protein
MEHNLAGYAKYYFYRRRDILRSGEFTRETDHNIKDFSRHWEVDAKNKLYFELKIVA